MADNIQLLSLIVLAQNIKGGVVRQANRRAALLRMLPMKIGSGKNVAFVAENTGILVENYSEGADVTNLGSDSQEQVLLSWAQNRANFHVSGLASATAVGSVTPVGNLELWARNMENASMGLASFLNAQAYTGAGTGTLIAGLDVAIGTTGNTYGGINRAVSTYFNPNVFNAAGPAVALSFSQIRSDLQAIYIASGSRPDVAMCHPNVMTKLAALFDPQKQYLFLTDKVETAAGKFELEGGIGGIKFDGCVFVEDKDATDGCIYYLNTNHVRLEVLPMDLARVPGMSDEIMRVVGNDGFGPLPLGFQLEMLAHTGDSDKAMVKSYLQLCVDRPNSCGKRLNIA